MDIEHIEMVPIPVSAPAPAATAACEETRDNAEAVRRAAEETRDAYLWPWMIDPENPVNWRSGKKYYQLLVCFFIAFTASMGASILGAAHEQIMAEFNVSSTAAFVPITTYLLGLSLGPVVGLSLTHIAGRKAVWYVSIISGGTFCIAATLASSFSWFCIARFISGFSYGPGLFNSAAVVSEIFEEEKRSVALCIVTLSLLVGSAIGPAIGVALLTKLAWRWTQHLVALLSLFNLILAKMSSDTYHQRLLRRRYIRLGLEVAQLPTPAAVFRGLIELTILRPLVMLGTEPLVGLLSLYVASMFAIPFAFFSSLFWVFQTNYGYAFWECRRIFYALGCGCAVGIFIVMISTVCYRHKYLRRFQPASIPPESHMLPAMIGSVLIPAGLFWLGWTADLSVHGNLFPFIGISLFGAGNVSLFISAVLYHRDAYLRADWPSAAAAHFFACHALAAFFPLFALQCKSSLTLIHCKLGVEWATSVLGFLAIAMMPLPFALFKYGRAFRARSGYEMVG
ncbi:hypothetical protein DL766_006085 [Monosporascus sp. MC13-8B]|uniref:Major facilitator superfamily (MFS) profile domain-containing protein n=1 Tax=Monosporascus cannonballus TaxID=155416 RepID=A0ABY0H0J1_9PEZI|nr:hypothetical protein DL762_006946 [Monosporascus cannonballus]RYO85880.1 hypothetical protein DL763_006911 [Monosporascus cannonballus]RYP28092.1 hypothetical protein DL766_006085 [Monosporascus sp. MC13-8B]